MLNSYVKQNPVIILAINYNAHYRDKHSVMKQCHWNDDAITKLIIQINKINNTKINIQLAGLEQAVYYIIIF